MTNKINTKLIIILLFTMLFTVVFTKQVNATTYTTRNELYNAGKNAVGQKVLIYKEHRPNDDAFGQQKSDSQVYCVQHDFTTGRKTYVDFTIKNYIKISGNVATNANGKSVTNNKNLALAYLIDQEDLRKGYIGGSDPGEVRNLAIKHYLTAGGWMSSVGTALGISNSDINYYNINTSNRGETKKQNVRNFLSRATSYASTGKGIPATMKLSPSIVKPSTMKQLGPVKLSFTGNLQSIKLYNGNTEVKDSKTFKVGNTTKSISQIASGNRVTIGKNTDSKVTKIEATSKTDSYIEAEMWLCVRSNAKQNLLLVRSSSKSNVATSSVKVEELTKGELKIKKNDANTKKALAAGFKIQTSSGKWLSGTNGSYNYNRTFANAEVYTSPKTLKDLNFGTYRIYEVKAPKNYVLEDQPGYDKTNKWIYFGTATINTNAVKVTKTVSNAKTRGKLSITKTDNKTKKALAAGFKIQTPSGKWLSGTNGAYNYDSAFEGATVYKSPITLKDLKYGTYKIYEVKAPKGYILEDQSGYDKTNNWVYFGTATLNNNTAKVTKTFTNKKSETGSLTINKLDKDTNKALAAGFKIQTSSGKWLSGSNGSYNYNNEFAGAQVYTSPVTLKGLKYDKYKVYEVVAPNGYDITTQDGYDKTNKWVPFGTVTINSKNTKVTKKYTNKQKISIKGYVWIDTQATKDGAFNSLYDNTRESKVAGVTVNLVNKSTKKVAATTKTDVNGEYIFDKLITKSQLKDYYVEFNYNGVKAKYKDYENKDIEEDISKYIPVAFNSVNVNDIKKEGSRAIMDSVATEDTKLSGIATTYKGTDKKETTYGLSGNLCDKLIEGTVLNNINLGIKKIPEADYNLRESLEYVNISIKGYTYRYNYGVAGNAHYIAAPTVNWQKAGTISGYTANIYPSDIVYNNNEDKTKNLQVNVGYRIDITNTTTTGTGDAANNYNELYKEKALHISSLANAFDTNRYTLNDSNWKAEGNVAKYQKTIADIEANKTGTVKINFSVNQDAIKAILEHPYGIIEKYPTTASTTGYHEYTRNDYSWKNNIIKTQTHRTVDDKRDASAPYLIFKLGQERIIKGRVFEDKVVTTNGEKLGNGIYDKDEKAVSGVKVELLDIQGNITNINTLSIEDINKLNASTLYRVKDMENNKKEAIMSTAMTTTGDDGTYEFRGIVPGQYFLRFTYGNGKQEITDLDGNKVEKEWNSKIDGTEINIRDYKSTIIANDKKNLIEKALTSVEESDLQWYKGLGNNYSVVLDNLPTRIGVNNDNTVQSMMAGTAKLSITVENDANQPAITEANKVTDNTESISDGENTADVKVEYLNEVTALNEFGGLNLGIIEMPKQEAKLEKIITKMKLTNAQNNKIFEGNPENDKMQGVSDLDNTKNGGSTYVRAELEDEMITGSTLELTYEIKITNISDVNYYNNRYYWFGEANTNKEVTLVVNELVDYLDETLQFNKNVSDQRFNIVTDSNLEQNDELAKKTIIKLSDNNTKLYTEKNTARNDNNCKTSDTATLVAQRVLSVNDEDMEFINHVKSNMNIGTDNRDKSADKDTEIKTIKTAVINCEAEARATITPPTGADRLTIIMYVVAGTIALAILSAGVVVIKRYVVK